jgi:hypothetical protein
MTLKTSSSQRVVRRVPEGHVLGGGERLQGTDHLLALGPALLLDGFHIFRRCSQFFERALEIVLIVYRAILEPAALPGLLAGRLRSARLVCQ